MAAPLPSRLRPGEVHLWFAFPDAPQLRDPWLLEAYDELMSAEERARQQRYLQARHRHQALVARALVRTTLSRYAPHVAATAWRFVLGEHGRPEIAGPAPVPPLRFNLSHTAGLMVVGIAHSAIGVDVEDSRRRVEGGAIAERFFAPAEVRQLEAGDASGFFDFWTLKEAYIKARGAGLALPLRQFAFELAPPRLAVSFTPQLEDAAGSWRFALLQPTPRHVAALAVRGRGPLRARVGQVVPLRSEAPLPCRVIAASGEG